jgi:hypothetical protein
MLNKPESSTIWTLSITINNEELQHWLVDQYSKELDTIHHNVQRLSWFTYAFHELWLSLLDRIDPEAPGAC